MPTSTTIDQTGSSYGLGSFVTDLINKGGDIAAIIAQQNLAKAQAKAAAAQAQQTTSANAAAQAQAAGTQTLPTGNTTKLPTWVKPVGIGVGLLALIGLTFAALRRR